MMNLNQFLIKIFELFPPGETENSGKLYSQYMELMQTNKQYNYEQAAKDFVMSYKYRKLPTIATLNEFLQQYRITITSGEQLEIRDIFAWAHDIKYCFAYRYPEMSYEEAKYELKKKGLTVNDTEQRVYD